jgi:lon-related putative ATP-dependent protease
MELKSEQLLRRAKVEEFDFTTTADLERLATPLAQDRALDALDFGVGMDFDGYNLYALGSVQSDKRAIVLDRLQALAKEQPAPLDLCYVENFEDPGRPWQLRFPQGEGRRFKHQMQEFIVNVRSMVPAAFSSDEYQQAAQALANAFRETQSEDLAQLEAQAQELGLAMMPTPNGFVFAPTVEGKVIAHEDFIALDEAERQRLQEAVTLMTNRLIERLRDYPQHEQQLIERQRTLRRETAEKVIRHLLARLRTLHQDNERLMAYFEKVEAELLDHLDLVVSTDRPQAMLFMPMQSPESFFERFNVNLIVDSGDTTGAPILYESNPSLENLVGKLEQKVQYGNLVTNFNEIRAGALHKANGGYLILDVERVLQKPFAWEALKRALGDGAVRIESVSQLLNLTYSVSLEPEAVPLQVKVVLLGSRMYYHLLREYDTDFDDLFKVVADFADYIDWTPENVKAYCAALARIVADTGILHLDAGAVGRVLEHRSRQVEDRERLSTHITEVRDLLQEADYLARAASAEVIGRSHVSEAIDKRIYRLDRFREMVRENIARGLIRIETSGAKIGQVNGLSVVNIGQVTFGQPMRITATARLGKGEVIDIERESHLGGNIHTKAVMIVSSFIGSRYAKETPLSLHGSLVFEQSYGGVEGDSASVAEVCALLSAIIDRPVKQSIAITGSMDQHGMAQAIGGVNEKIEGFFEICRAQGFDGTQGVIIPEANIQHLMLREEVVDAVAQGQFHVYSMNQVDDAASLLLAGPDEIHADMDVINSAVRERLKALSVLIRQKHGSQDNGE